MAEYRTVEGEGSATANTLTNLTTFGSETSVGPIKVPAAASSIVEIWAAVSFTIDTADDNVGHFLRLSGKGMAQGDQDFTLGAVGGGVTSTGTTANPAIIYPVELSVVANENINVAVVYTGDTTSAATIGITLVFA